MLVWILSWYGTRLFAHRTDARSSLAGLRLVRAFILVQSRFLSSAQFHCRTRRSFACKNSDVRQSRSRYLKSFGSGKVALHGTEFDATISIYVRIHRRRVRKCAQCKFKQLLIRYCLFVIVLHG